MHRTKPPSKHASPRTSLVRHHVRTVVVLAAVAVLLFVLSYVVAATMIVVAKVTASLGVAEHLVCVQKGRFESVSVKWWTGRVDRSAGIHKRGGRERGVERRRKTI